MKWIATFIFFFAFNSCGVESDNPPYVRISLHSYFFSSDGKKDLMKGIPIDTINDQNGNFLEYKLNDSIYKVKIYFNNQYQEDISSYRQNNLYMFNDSLGNNCIDFSTDIDREVFKKWKKKTFDIKILMQCSHIFNDTIYHDISIQCYKYSIGFKPIFISLDGKEGDLKTYKPGYFNTVKFLIDRN